MPNEEVDSGSASLPKKARKVVQLSVSKTTVEMKLISNFLKGKSPIQNGCNTPKQKRPWLAVVSPTTEVRLPVNGTSYSKLEAVAHLSLKKGILRL